MKTMMNLAGMALVPELYNQRIIKIHAKYLFSLIGFGIGSILSLISLVFEEYRIDFPGGTSHLPHLAVPFLFGIIGSVIGYIYGKKRHDKTEAFQEIFVNQQTMSLILNHLPVLIAYLDSDLRCRYVNKTFEDWHELSFDDVYGKPVKDLVSAQTFELINFNIAKATRGEIISFESSREYKGEEHFVISTIVPHLGFDKKIKGFFTIVTDITKLKRRENKIRKQKDELAELNAEKDKFFSIISHDLKNPFNSLLGFSELLHDDFDTLDETTKKEFAGHIYVGAQNTYKLLENLLAWSTAQSGKIEFNPSPMTINALVAENLKLLDQMARAKNIQLQSDLKNDYFIITDHDLVNTVIRNLLSNAIKFTPKDGQVTISANLVSGIEPNEFLEISVKDTGLGIAPENLEKLFKIGKSHSTSGTEGESGTGLGLMLCKEFVEKSGGKIWVESVVGKGSTFYFSLPIK
jgi:PAS domain S-box-containing protein